MGRVGRTVVVGVVAVALPAAAAEPSRAALAVPPGLPRYDLEVRLDLAGKTVTAVERVRFTNRSAAVVGELVFHVYPRYRVGEQDRAILSKTLEVLRLSPDEALDPVGRRLSVSAVRVGGRAAPHAFDPHDDTILIVPLASPVAPGGVVSAEIAFTLQLPHYWGRWGHYNGVTYLTNWYPVLAHHEERGWERTRFVPWHQPWHQEAGHVSVHGPKYGCQLNEDECKTAYNKGSPQPR